MKEKRTVEDALKTTSEMMNNLPKVLDFSHYLVKQNIEDYEKWLVGGTVGFSEDKLTEMGALGVLDKLGWPMDKPGTYLFKELVVDVYNKIKDASIDECRKVAKDLMSKNSNIKNGTCEYLEISQGKFDKLVSYSMEAINHDRKDKETASRIFGQGTYPGMGAIAYRLAQYMKNYTINRNNHVVGRFSATTFNDQDIYFKVYDNDMIECPTLGIDFARKIVLKPRFELYGETLSYEYDAPKSYKGDTRGLIKDYNIDEDLLAYLKSKGMVKYSTDMAYLYDFKDKNGYDKKNQTRSFKWASPKKSLELARKGFFD